ncbi:hypothetical protein AAHE18_02G097600 [Arachis hypogaea]
MGKEDHQIATCLLLLASGKGTSAGCHWEKADTDDTASSSVDIYLTASLDQQHHHCSLDLSGGFVRKKDGYRGCRNCEGVGSTYWICEEKWWKENLG